MASMLWASADSCRTMTGSSKSQIAGRSAASPAAVTGPVRASQPRALSVAGTGRSRSRATRSVSTSRLMGLLVGHAAPWSMTPITCFSAASCSAACRPKKMRSALVPGQPAGSSPAGSRGSR